MAQQSFPFIGASVEEMRVPQTVLDMAGSVDRDLRRALERAARYADELAIAAANVHGAISDALNHREFLIRSLSSQSQKLDEAFSQVHAAREQAAMLFYLLTTEYGAEAINQAA